MKRQKLSHHVKEFRSLKNVLRHVDSQSGLEFNDKLFQSIMSQVETAPSQKTVDSRYEGLRWFVTAASLVGILFSAGYVLKAELSLKGGGQIAENGASQAMIEASLQDPVGFAETLNSPQAPNDFVLEALAYQMSGLSDTQIENAFEELIDE